MIIYQCKDCGCFGRKLWRYAATSCIELQCIRCIEAETGERLAFSRGGLALSEIPQYMDQIAGRVPAVPSWEDSNWYGYTSVPQGMCEWWLRLPL